MATTVEPGEKHQYVEFDEYIDFQLKKTRGNIKWTEIATAIVGLAVLFLTYLFVFVLLDHWVIEGGFSRTARGVMLGVLGVASLSWLAWKVVLPYLRQVNSLFAARTIERFEPTLKSSLLNLVDLQQAQRPIPEEVRTSLEKRAAVTLAHIDVEQTVDRRPLMWSAYALLAIVVLSCLYALMSPKRISNSLWRAVLPTADVSVPTQTEIREVTPGNAEVPAGTRLEIVAELGGQIPDEVMLHYTTADRRFVEEPVIMRDTDEGRRKYRCVLSGENGRGLLQATEYHIVAGDAHTQTFQVAVVQPPSAKVTEIRYEYPEYMELDPKSDPTGHIDAWEGTAVTLTAEANMPLESATLQFADDPETLNKAEEIPLQISGGTKLRAEWRLKLRSDGSYPRHYRIHCQNERGDVDPEPTLYNVTIRPDQAPEITLIDPAGDIEKPANAVVPLLFHAQDPDFKLSYITLRAEKDEAPIADEMIFDGSRQTVGGTYDFELSRLRLNPGDVVTFWIEARDNKQPIGNRKNTPRINIRIVEPVSQEEVQEQLEKDKQSQQEALEPVEGQEPPPQDAAEDQDTEQPEEGEQDEGSQQGSKQAAGEEGESGEQQAGGESSQEQAGEQGSDGEPGGESKLDPDNPDDTGEVIEKLYKRMQQEQQQQESQDSEQQEEGSQAEQQQSESAKGEQAGSQSEQQSEKQQGAQPDSSDAAGENSEGQEGGQKKDGEAQERSEESGEPGSGEPSDSQPSDRQQPGSRDTEGGQGSKEEQGKPGGQQSEEQGDEGNPSDRRESQEPGGKQGSGEQEQDPTGKGEPTGEKPDGSEQPGTVERTDESQPGAREQQGKPGAGENTEGAEEASDPGSAKPQGMNNKPGEDRAETDPASDQGAPAQEADPNSKPREKQSDVDRPDTSRPADEETEDPQSGKTPPKGSGRPQGAPSDETPPPSDSAIKPDQPPEGGGSPGESTPSPAQGEGDSPMPGEQRDGDAQPAPDPRQGDREGAQQSGESNGESSQQKGKPSGGQQSESAGDQTGDGEPGSQPGQQGKGEGQQNPSGEPSSAQGQQPGGSQSQSGAQQLGGQADGQRSAAQGQGEGGSSPGPGADEANLEHAKEAANLVLKRLESELERGEVDPQLLDELGWTQDEVRKFTDRLKNKLDTEPADTPESIARRRQFEETLKTLDLKSAYGPRQDSGTRSTRSDSISVRRSQVPAEYRDDYDAFTRSRAKRGRTANQP